MAIYQQAYYYKEVSLSLWEFYDVYYKPSQDAFSLSFFKPLLGQPYMNMKYEIYFYIFRFALAAPLSVVKGLRFWYKIWSDGEQFRCIIDVYLEKYLEI